MKTLVQPRADLVQAPMECLGGACRRWIPFRAAEEAADVLQRGQGLLHGAGRRHADLGPHKKLERVERGLRERDDRSINPKGRDVGLTDRLEALPGQVARVCIRDEAGVAKASDRAECCADPPATPRLERMMGGQLSWALDQMLLSSCGARPTAPCSPPSMEWDA